MFVRLNLEDCTLLSHWIGLMRLHDRFSDCCDRVAIGRYFRTQCEPRCSQNFLPLNGDVEIANHQKVEKQKQNTRT